MIDAPPAAPNVACPPASPLTSDGRGSAAAAARPPAWASPPTTADAQRSPWFVPIGPQGLTAALRELSRKVQREGRASLLAAPFSYPRLSRLLPWSLTVEPGRIGLASANGLPKVVLEPGSYPFLPDFPWMGWNYWRPTLRADRESISFYGLTIERLQPGEAAIVFGDGGECLVHTGGGYACMQPYKTIGRLGREPAHGRPVDARAVSTEVYLSGAVRKSYTCGRRVAGERASAPAASGAAGAGDTLMAYALEVFSNAHAVVSREGEVATLPAGHHIFTAPGVALRGVYSTLVEERTFPARSLTTRDGMRFHVTPHARWQVTDAARLAEGNFEDASDALEEMIGSELSKAYACRSWSDGGSGDGRGPALDGDAAGTRPSGLALDGAVADVTEKVTAAALHFGIELRSIGELDREPQGKSAENMAALNLRRLQAEAASQAMEVEARNSQQQADIEANLQRKRIKLAGELALQEATSYRDAARVRAAADREALTALAETYAAIKDDFAKQMLLDQQRHVAPFREIGPRLEGGRSLVVLNPAGSAPDPFPIAGRTADARMAERARAGDDAARLGHA